MNSTEAAHSPYKMSDFYLLSVLTVVIGGFLLVILFLMGERHLERHYYKNLIKNKACIQRSIH